VRRPPFIDMVSSESSAIKADRSNSSSEQYGWKGSQQPEQKIS